MKLSPLAPIELPPTSGVRPTRFVEVIDADEQVAATLRGALARAKVVHLRGVDPQQPLYDYYRGLASSLGDFLYKNENPVTGALDTDGWLDMRYDAELADEHPYRHGNDRMQLHIDGVYTDVFFDIMVIWCAAAATHGGAGTFIDGVDVVRYLESYDKGLLDALLATPMHFRKGEKSRLSPIIFYQDGLPAFNWNLPRLSDENPPEVRELALRFYDFCERRLVDGGLVTHLRLEVGEAVFFHNRLLLHGRDAFWGERCLLKGAVDSRGTWTC